MTYSEKMLGTVSKTVGELGSSLDLMRDFLRSLMMPDGGFKGRGQASDLYYTAFALDCMAAIDMDIVADVVVRYLNGFASGDRLDLVHLACLTRSWKRVGLEGMSEVSKQGLIANIKSCRSADGGYSREKNAAFGSIYGCFFAESAFQDLGCLLPDSRCVVKSIRALKTSDGLFRAERGVEIVTTNAVAGAILLMKSINGSVEDEAVSWLVQQCHDGGGFVASPDAPVPDLVSTATALFALQEAGASFDEISEKCIDFVEGLWSDCGGFMGHWLDDDVDCEYTFYGLLSLGVLFGAEMKDGKMDVR